MRDALDEIPTAAHHVYICKWKHILGLLQSITTAVSRQHGMLMRLQQTLWQACGRRVQLSTPIQDELSAFFQIVQDLADRPTHLHELDPFHPKWEGATDNSGTGMGGVFQEPGGQWFAWSSQFPTETQSRLVLDTNPNGRVTINDLDIAALLTQVQIFAPNMDTLAHIQTAVDNTEAQGRDNHGSVRLAMAVGSILRDLALMTSMHNI